MALLPTAEPANHDDQLVGPEIAAFRHNISILHGHVPGLVIVGNDDRDESRRLPVRWDSMAQPQQQQQNRLNFFSFSFSFFLSKEIVVGTCPPPPPPPPLHKMAVRVEGLAPAIRFGSSSLAIQRPTDSMGT